MGEPLNIASLESLKTSKSIATSLDETTLQAVTVELENQLNELEKEFQNTKNKNGWLSGSWDKFKNWSGIGASSNKTQSEINNLKEQIKNLKNNPKELDTVFKNITGKDLTIDNLSQIVNRETTLLDASKAGEKVNKYSEGQNMAVDVVADMVSGMAAVGVVALGSAIGICAAPFTAGASLGLVAAGLGLAAGTGAAVKSAIKASDCIGNEKEYTLQNLGYDITTGALNGAMAPLSNAIGGAAGTGIMKAAGMEALETQVVKSAAAAGGKAIIKEAGEKVALSAGQKAIKLAASGVTMALDGGLSGATDAFARDIATGNTDNLLKDTLQGFGAGAAGGVVIGGGFKVAGKAGAKLGSTEAAQALGGAIKKTTGGLSDLAGDAVDGLANHSRIVRNISSTLSDFGDNLNSKAIATSLKNCLTIGDDGLYNVNVGSYTVKLAKDELSDEILEAISKNDNTAVFNYAKGILNDALSEQAQKEAAERAAMEALGEVEPKGQGKIAQFKDKTKTFIKDKLKQTKTGQRIVNDYETAKANFLNKPNVQNPDSKVMSEIGEYFANVKGLVEGEEAFSEGLGKLVNSISDVSELSINVTMDLATMSDDFAQSINKQTAIIQDFLEKYANGEDISEAVAEFAKKGIDISDFINEKTINNLDSFAIKMEQLAQNADDCSKTAAEFVGAVQKNSNEILNLYSDAKDILTEIPDTKAFKQLGEMPERVKGVLNDINADASNISEQYLAAAAKIQSGDIEGGLKELQAYYDNLSELQVKFEAIANDANATATSAGLYDTASTLSQRLKTITSKEGYSNLTTTQKAQSIVEESNIAFSKIIQTMSSDETLPDGVRSFFKEFTSNCTVSRNLDEAQKFADEIYGAGKYTLEKSIGAGSVGETYLVKDASGNEFVMKMLKQGVNQEKFEADRAMFTKYIDEFITDAADKEYKLKLINGLFDSWEKELDYGSEALAAKEMLNGAQRFNVAQTVEVGALEGNNVSLVMQKADGIGLDDLISLLDFKNQHPNDYLTLSMVNKEGKELNPWIRKADLIEANSWVKDTDAYAEALPIAYQKAQNEQSMFLSKQGTKTVHADPHGGNVFVDFDPVTGTPKITYIDTGNTLTRTNAEILSDISLSLNMLIGNSEGIATSLLDNAVLPSGLSQQEAIEQVAKLLDDRLYKAGVNLKDVNYTQSTMMGILSELNIIPDSSNSNLLKANLQRIKTSREIFAVTGTEANKSIDIKDMLTGIKQSFKTDPKGTIKQIKPIIKWAFQNKDQTLTTFFQMMFKESSFTTAASSTIADAAKDTAIKAAAGEISDATVRTTSDDITEAILREGASLNEALGLDADDLTRQIETGGGAR